MSDVQVRVQFRKLVTCGHCGCVYCVDEPREVDGNGTSEAGALENAEGAARAEWSDIPLEPCPQCYRIPITVPGSNQLWFLGLSFLLAVVALVMSVFAAIDGIRDRAPKIESVLWQGSAGVLVACLAGIWLVCRQPNRNLARNRARVEKSLACGVVRIVRAGSTSSEMLPKPAIFRQAALIAAAGIVASLLLQTAPIYRRAQGWDYRNNLTPSVVEPGNEVVVTLPDIITSVDGHWRGNVQAQLQVPGEADTWIQIDSQTHQSAYKNEILATKIVAASRLWAKVRIPNDPKLAGKQVRIHLVLDVTYPDLAGVKQFKDTQQRVQHTVDVKLAPPGFIKTYYTANAIGVFSAAVLLVLIGILALATFFYHPCPTVTLEQLAVAYHHAEPLEREPQRPWDRRS